jgi:hypothetical protein
MMSSLPSMQVVTLHKGSIAIPCFTFEGTDLFFSVVIMICFAYKVQRD